MEHRVVLTTEEASELSNKLTFKETSYVKDVYTGKKRIRTDDKGKERIKEYETPIEGVVERFSSLCELDNIKNIWFEVKWTKDKTRFEVEFEEKVPEKYKNKPNVKGWEILK